MIAQIVSVLPGPGGIVKVETNGHRRYARLFLGRGLCSVFSEFQRERDGHDSVRAHWLSKSARDAALADIDAGWTEAPVNHRAALKEHILATPYVLGAGNADPPGTRSNIHRLKEAA